MDKNLENSIAKIDFEHQTILEVAKQLNEAYSLTDISHTMTKLRKRKQIFPPNDFGKCGIDRRANDCGDASEY